ncbi:DedA family protein [Actinoplanes sp. NPDC051861]|uniref:DedA family protein n=1 Tax=Actinoplanes sp. NPDC051861 TaxID=3155170 RepID=UPI003448A684
MPHYVDSLAAGRWVLVIVFTVALLDVILPFIPAETIVVAVGVVAAGTGRPAPAWVIVVAAAGVFLGDQLGYLIGHRSGPAVTARLRRGLWVLDIVRRHGALLIVFGRYVPGVRSATAFTTGAVGYPRRRFALFTVIGAVLWAAQATLLGYLGGAVSEDPLIGFALGWGGAIVLTGAAMGVQHALRRPRPAAPRRPVSRRSPRAERPDSTVGPSASSRGR